MPIFARRQSVRCNQVVGQTCAPGREPQLLHPRSRGMSSRHLMLFVYEVQKKEEQELALAPLENKQMP